LKGVAFGIHLQVIAFSRSMSLSEARDLAAKNAHELPSDLALAIAGQVTPGTLADSFATDIYRRCLTS
jgi:nicotinamide mononucleotide (NMN) deamidase PncC